MWTCTPACKLAFAQPGMWAGSLVDMRKEVYAVMSPLPHEDTNTASHAVMLTNTVAATRAGQHADNSALRHIANAHMTARQQVRLHACPHSQLPYNPTPQQEGMRT